jgi:hypothetical protein
VEEKEGAEIVRRKVCPRFPREKGSPEELELALCNDAWTTPASLPIGLIFDGTVEEVVV